MKKPTVSFADFQKLDIRAGEIKDAARLEGSRNLIIMHVDLGTDYGVVEILSGLADLFVPEDLVGKKFAFVANLEPRPLMGKVSNGMILVAEEEAKIFLVPLPEPVPVGSVVR
jgi:methionyl-tRNA synthetase